MFARKKPTSTLAGQPAAPTHLVQRNAPPTTRMLPDTPRIWPRGRPDEIWSLIRDLLLSIAHLAWWIVAALGRLIFVIVRLIALGLGKVARAISGQRLQEHGAEIIGWVLVAIILILTATSVSFAQGWLPLHQNTSRHALSPPFTPPATPPACVVQRVACTDPVETMDSLPSLSETTILDVLQTYHSPAASADFANDLYDLGFKYGVNPAYALAFFIEESNCGTKGIAVTTLSIGNIRYTQSSSPVTYTDDQGFRQYASWSDGAEDWYWLIRTYYLNEGVRDIYDVTPIYAPVTDNNNPQQYAQSVVQFVMSWTK